MSGEAGQPAIRLLERRGVALPPLSEGVGEPVAERHKIETVAGVEAGAQDLLRGVAASAKTV